MVLPNFILHQSADRFLTNSGIDSIEYCNDPDYFRAYPYKVDYKYNSRGYRDQEWPESMEELTSSIWCFGDSFTVGIGSPLEHTWPYLLSTAVNKRTINVSMDGASNNWIARKVKDLFTQLQPNTVILHWSYAHRREMQVSHSKNYIEDYFDKFWLKFYLIIKDSSWPDCNTRREFFNLPQRIQDEILSRADDQITVMLKTAAQEEVIHDEKLRLFCSENKEDGDKEDIKNTISCIESVEAAKPAGTQVIHSFIPMFGGIEEHPGVQWKVYKYLEKNNISFAKRIDVVDWARDHHHYGRKTAANFVADLQQLLR